MKAKPNGFVLWRDSWRVAIATGIARPSANRKTGPMVQVWIIPTRKDPTKISSRGVVCFDCPIQSECYVNWGNAPLMVWQGFKRGSFPWLPSADVFTGRRIRWGACGEPTLIPLELMTECNKAAFGWTGYTHRWEEKGIQPYRRFLMASCESEKGARKAAKRGWRSYRIGENPGVAGGDALCVNAQGLQCYDCLLCSGTAGKGKGSIYIPAHGTGARSIRDREVAR